ncbi:MAG: hypothetical protein GY870_07685 [archaeon]|nr:hypothetical protein [archaeon]
MKNISDTLKAKIKIWTLYSKMTSLGEIARRYFVMNFFDGVLTVLGVVIANLILFVNGNGSSSTQILVYGLSVSVAIGISGITGGYLAERAERKVEIIELYHFMADEKAKIHLNEEDYYPTQKDDKNKISSEFKENNQSNENLINKSKSKNEKTLAEKAIKFATNVASSINGFAPALGGIVCLIPFFFIINPIFETYIIAFILIGIVLFMLGVYLAKISEDNIWGYGILMVFAGIITGAISWLLS